MEIFYTFVVTREREWFGKSSALLLFFFDDFVRTSEVPYASVSRILCLRTLGLCDDDSSIV